MDGIYEYCGTQRKGKSTLMVADLMNKILNPAFGYSYVPDEIFANFNIFISGVHCLNNEKMLEILTRAKRENWQHKVYMIDECSQPPLFYARNSMDKLQTELVTSLWQMPKKGCICQYTSNVGNSVDVQMRDATHITIMPYRYNSNPVRELESIDYRVIHGYDCWYFDETYLQPAYTQKFFNSFKAVL